MGQIKLYRPNQSLLQTQSLGIGTQLVEPELLPVTGTYQFLLDPTGNGTGTTAFTLYNKVPADFSGTTAADATGRPVSTTVPGQNGALTFSGSQNDRVRLVVSPGPLE